MATQKILDYLKDYRTKNKERISEQKKQWYKKHIIEERLKRKTHYQNNRQDYIDRAAKWSKDNPEKMNISRENWRKNNMEKCNLRGTNYRAKKRNAISETYNRLIVYENDSGNCGICGKYIFKSFKFPHPQSFSIDHIWPISLGGQDILANVQSAHFGCNSRKRDRV